MHRLAAGHAARGWLGIAVLSGALAACGHGVAPQQVLARQCSPIGGPRQAVLTVVAPAAGTLRIAVEERGISTVATLDDNAGTASASPVERFGTIVLTAEARPAGPHTVRVQAEDSPAITGEVCISAELVGPSNPVRAEAERDLFAAARAVRAQEWDAAFHRYLSAARGFDHLHLRRSAAMTRHAMAELAYRRFDRKRDSYALAGEASAGYGGAADPMLVGLLAVLQAKALLDMPGSDPRAVAPQVRNWLSVARKDAGTSRFGERELPRVDIMAGYLEFMLDEPDRARSAFAEAAGRCRELQDWDCYAFASQNLAQLAEESKNYAAALSAYADALRRLPPQLDPKLTAGIWNNLGRLQGVVGLVSSSERSNAAAMRAYATLGDCPGVRLSLARTGRLLVQVGTLADAESYLEQAASLDCPSLLAAVAARSAPGTSAAAKDPCARPLDPGPLATQNKIIVFNSLLSLADAAMLQGESAQARICLDAARPYAADSRAQVRLANARGAVLLERNDPAGARAAFEDALRIADEARFPPTYEHRGTAQLGLVKAMLLAGNAADSVQEAYEALQSSVARGDIDRIISSLRLVAAGYRASGQPAAAVRTLQAAADLIEAVPIDELDGEKRATYLGTQHAVFAELTDLFAAQSQTNAQASWLAFATSERGRARSLRYALNQATRDAALEAPGATRYQQLLQELVHLAAQADASRGREALIDAIDQAAVRERSAEQPLERKQLGQTLEQLHATLVEYAVGSRDMFAFIVAGGAVHVVHLGDRHEIASAVGQLLDRLRDAEAPTSEVRAAAGRLARLVLWPLGRDLAAKRIIFVPDDALHTVPFSVLPWSAEASAQLVVQHAETSVIPSALFLTNVHLAAVARPEAPRIELIGDPVFRVADWRRKCGVNAATESSSTERATRTLSDWTESLPPLPGARAEVMMVARLAEESRPAGRVETLVGCAAVPRALRRAANQGAQLLHIATHARIDAQRPRLSALALTPQAGKDPAPAAFGLLDILDLKLKSRLVVLSACDTSRGRLLPGEGVLGPAQAFLQAGAASVLASYWRVDDQATSSFMQQFYRYLLIDRLSASAALRKAQLDRARAGPAYEWAAFALYGWPDSYL